MKKNENNYNIIEWNNTYKSQKNRHKNRYPSEMIVSWVKRNYATLNKYSLKCLDLGCGYGNNLLFLKEEGFDCYGIDFSEHVISTINLNLKNKLTCGSLVDLPYKNNFFDFCIDRSSIQHNPKNDIFLIFKEIHRVLKKNGKIYSMLLKKAPHSEFHTSYLDQKEIQKALEIFNSIEINYLTLTNNFGAEVREVYLIEAMK